MKKVLIIEDDRKLAAMYSFLLEDNGYITKIAYDGEAGLSEAVTFMPDLVITDIMMPEVGGHDLVDALKSKPETKEIKIIVLTASRQPKIIERALSKGAEDCLIKSETSAEDVLRVVAECLLEVQNEHSSGASEKASEPLEKANNFAASTLVGIIVFYTVGLFLFVQVAIPKIEYAKANPAEKCKIDLAKLRDNDKHCDVDNQIKTTKEIADERAATEAAAKEGLRRANLTPAQKCKEDHKTYADEGGQTVYVTCNEDGSYDITTEAEADALIDETYGCNIKGNISYNSGERIYHVPGQSYYDETQINSSYGERWFCSESEAQSAGWRRAYN